MVYRLQSSAIQRNKFLRNESIQKRQRKLKCINHVIAVKSTKGISKSHIANAQSAKCGHKMTDMLKVLDALMEIAAEETLHFTRSSLIGVSALTLKLFESAMRRRLPHDCTPWLPNMTRHCYVAYIPHKTESY